ncbi:MAG TPA: acyltransferase [Acidobacteriaceae bacterium]|jgi:peptidoglycan/LPS O-acetylase OafA/YrhL|nr:acyltransferase [Acidobacteriaceae bacterium]
MSKRFYRPELDALRFFAFACIFCAHMPLTAHWYQLIRESGTDGMCMFFMLSAYLIVSILLREREATGTVNWKAFAIRRILRIWPLYFAVLFLGVALRRFWPNSYITPRAVIGFCILLGNLVISRRGWIMGPLAPLWSLSVEEQFYLGVPMMARTCSRRTMATICGVTIIVAYITLFSLGSKNIIPVQQVWTNSFVQFQFFAVGCLLALWMHGRQLRLSSPFRIMLAAAGIAQWLVANGVFHLHSYQMGAANRFQLMCGYALLLVGTTMIFLAVINAKWRIPHAIIYLGKISYGLYVFHAFFVYLIFYPMNESSPMHYFQSHKVVGIVLSFCLTVAASALSYHFFERPILKFKERFETIHTRPA